jgi:hypothetical protein
MFIYLVNSSAHIRPLLNTYLKTTDEKYAMVIEAKANIKKYPVSFSIPALILFSVSTLLSSPLNYTYCNKWGL